MCLRLCRSGDGRRRFPAEEPAECGGEFGGRVLLDEVPCAGQQMQPGTGDGGGEPPGVADGEPGVLGAPADEDGQVEAAVAVLDLVGPALVVLGDLPVERGLARLVQPGFGQPFQDVGPQSGAADGGDVLPYQRAVQE